MKATKAEIIDQLEITSERLEQARKDVEFVVNALTEDER